MVDCSTLLEEGDENDVMRGYINKKAFNPYRATVRARDLKFVCPNTTTLPTQGHFGSNEVFEYIKVAVTRCHADDLEGRPSHGDDDGRPLNECFADDQVYQRVNVALMNSNIDFSQSNADDTVTYGIESEVIMLDPNIDQKQNLYYMKSQVEVSDDLYLLFQNRVSKTTF